MTTERCPRCDRAECPWWATPDPQSDDDLFAIGHEARDCELHAVPIERWRQRALAAEAALDAARAANREWGMWAYCPLLVETMALPCRLAPLADADRPEGVP